MEESQAAVDVRADPGDTALYSSGGLFSGQDNEDGAEAVPLNPAMNGAAIEYDGRQEGTTQDQEQVFPSVQTAAHVPLSQQCETPPLPPIFTGAINIEEIRARLDEFCGKRDWQQFHTPRYLLLEIVKRSGELACFFQRPNMGESNLEFQRGDNIGAEDRSRLEEQLASVLLAVCQLADRCGIDLGAAVFNKLERNDVNYPINRYRGKMDFPASSSRPAGGKRKRFTGTQLDALRKLAEGANWSLLSISKSDREKFCADHGISKERMHNFFNNRKPKDLKKTRTATGAGTGGDGQDPGQDPDADMPVI